jgi:nitroimidazol reductase NimA-like FMN-containing flavoprotein (pyridoxamine 5'-phosphate oxidase superfamily)
MPDRPDIRLTPDEQAAYLRANRKCALATLDKDGFPHVTAMNFVMRDGAFYMTSYGKAQKVVNIRRNPKTAIMVETGSAYAELKGVMVSGECHIIEGEDLVRRRARRDLQAAVGGVEQRPEADRPQNRPAQNCHLGPQQARRPVLTVITPPPAGSAA